MANKTTPVEVGLADHLAGIAHPVRRRDAEVLAGLMTELSGEAAEIWRGGIVGFGRYHYRYDSGREGDFFRVGFAARKANLVLYVMPGFDAYDDLLSRLGKHKHGKSCLYVNKLADVDMDVLRELIRASIAQMDAQYPRS